MPEKAEMKEKMKWLYTFFLLIVMIGWAVFLVKIVMNALVAPEPIDVIGAAGVGVLLGAMIVWNGNVNKHWFGGEKKPPEEPPPSPS